MIKWIILAIFILSALYIQQRGKVRHSFYRQFFDHSTILAPINYLMYMFSKVPNQPYIDTQHFQDLRVLDENWEMIRDEAKALYEKGGIKASSSYDDLGFNSFFKTGWKRFYLKWYDSAHPSAAELCKRVIEMVEVFEAMIVLSRTFFSVSASTMPFTFGFSVTASITMSTSLNSS